MNDDKKTSACHGAGPLEHAVLLNEEIKQVIGFAARVNMTALNANLMARRAGDRSRGFRVVAAQLRVFSDQLEEYMGELARLISQQVRGIAHMLKNQYHGKLFRRSQQMGESGHLDAFLTTLDGQFDATCRAVGQGWHQLATWVASSLRLCRTGESLVWSARMEAARGGEMEPALRQVAEGIAEVMEGIVASLGRQRARLAGLQP